MIPRILLMSLIIPLFATYVGARVHFRAGVNFDFFNEYLGVRQLS